MTRSCSDCGKGLGRGTKGERCRACWSAKRALSAKFCTTCGIEVDRRQNTSGYCRSCLLAKNNSDPEIVAKRIASVRTALARPETIAKLRRNQIERTRDPAFREMLREAGKRNYHLTVGSEKAKRRAQAPETIARRARTHRENDMAWCPPAYREEYTKLMRRIRAANARVVIEQRIRDDKEQYHERLASMSPFERQMEALKNGAKLIEKPVLRQKDYDFSLHGGSLG